jgi:hypothetical protein
VTKGKESTALLSKPAEKLRIVWVRITENLAELRCSRGALVVAAAPNSCHLMILVQGPVVSSHNPGASTIYSRQRLAAGTEQDPPHLLSRLTCTQRSEIVTLWARQLALSERNFAELVSHHICQLVSSKATWARAERGSYDTGTRT